MSSDGRDVRNTESRAVENLFVLVFVVVNKVHVVFCGCGKWLTQFIYHFFVGPCVTCKPVERICDVMRLT